MWISNGCVGLKEYAVDNAHMMKKVFDTRERTEKSYNTRAYKHTGLVIGSEDEGGEFRVVPINTPEHTIREEEDNV